ncbi:MAG: NADH-quinone oxidoreductase subunit N [Fulvivirga sp.]|nr:NADH-quinone oxidoreductase subunit N [Fulvivirga sp.]
MKALADKLLIIAESLGFVVPEVLITIAIIVIIVLDLIGKNKFYKGIILFAFLSACMIWMLSFAQLNIGEKRPLGLFLGMIRIDQLSTLWKLIIDTGLIITVLIQLRRHQSRYGAEFLSFMFFIVLGAHFLIMSNHLLMVFLSIEIMSIGAYVLTTYAFKAQGYEAGMKYLLFGGIASAVMLYGMSLIYAYTGTLQFFSPDFNEALLKINMLPLLVAGVMVLAGILFKITAAPMHIWAPDTYELAPTPAVALFSTIPKLAGLAVLIKWLLAVNVFGLGNIPWDKLVGAIAILTLTIGNFSALWQSNVKRMLAYSSIAHSGFLLIGLVAFSVTGLQSMLFYAGIYLLMNMAIFLLVNFFESKYNLISFADYKGAGKVFPYFTALMVIILIALTGLPPTAGFTAKLFVFSALWEKYSVTGENWVMFLFAFGLFNAVISLFYYLKLPYLMIFKEGGVVKKKKFDVLENFLGTILVLALLLLFFKPDWLMNMINNVNFAF